MSRPKQTDKKETPEASLPAAVREEDIARCAYALYLARGGADGHALDDWLEAEKQLRAEAGSQLTT